MSIYPTGESMTYCNVTRTSHDLSAVCPCGETCPICGSGRHDDIAYGPESTRLLYCFGCGNEYDVNTVHAPSRGRITNES